MIVCKFYRTRPSPWRDYWVANYCGSLYVGSTADEALSRAWADLGGHIPALIFTGDQNECNRLMLS